MKQLSGKDFDTKIGDMMVHVEAFSLTITDNRAVAKTKGVPVGHTDGDAEASGEIEVDSANFAVIVEAARSAGSFKDLEPFDIVSMASSGSVEARVEAFDCLLSLSDLLSVDPNSNSKTTHKIPFIVTSPDFVRFNGVPYLTAAETENLI